MDTDTDNARRSFGLAVKSERDRRGWSQEYLGAQMDVSQATVATWERAINVPDAQTIFRLERVLGLRPGALSQYFDYVPLNSPKGRQPQPNVAEAILRDGKLTQDAKTTLLAAYRALTSAEAVR